MAFELNNSTNQWENNGVKYVYLLFVSLLLLNLEHPMITFNALGCWVWSRYHRLHADDSMVCLNCKYWSMQK